MEKDHDLADDLLFRPGVLDALAAAGADAIDLFETLRKVFDNAEDFFPERIDKLLRIFGADAFDHATAEITLDAFASGGRDGAEFLGAEFETVVFVVDPVTFGGKPFAGSDTGKGTDDRDEIAAALGFDLEDGEAGFVAEKRDAFDDACDGLDGLLGGLSGRVGRSGGVRGFARRGIEILASVIDGREVKLRTVESRSGFREASSERGKVRAAGWLGRSGTFGTIAIFFLERS